MMQSSLRILGLAGDAYVPRFAPVVALAFLGAGFTLAVSGVGAAVALAAGRRSLARLLGGAALAVASGYATALAASSLLSPARTLASGEKKYFCEIDCHLAYSVARSAREDGSLAVTVRTWFDPKTIAGFRGDAPLTPNPREVWLELPDGRRLAPSEPATATWRARHGETASLSDALRPGESSETTFVFAAASSAPGARLFVGDPPGIESLLIGHENGPFHRRTLFALPGSGPDESEAPPASARVDPAAAPRAIDRGGRS